MRYHQKASNENCWSFSLSYKSLPQGGLLHPLQQVRCPDGGAHANLQTCCSLLTLLMCDYTWISLLLREGLQGAPCRWRPNPFLDLFIPNPQALLGTQWLFVEWIKVEWRPWHFNFPLTFSSLIVWTLPSGQAAWYFGKDTALWL